MKKYILLFGCLIISLFLMNCENNSIKNNKSLKELTNLEILLEEFYEDSDYFVITANVDIFGQYAEATSRICLDPFYLDIDGKGRKAYMIDGDFLFLYEFQGNRINRTLVGNIYDKSVDDLLDYGEPLDGIDLTKCDISYNKKTNEYIIKCNVKEALDSLSNYMGDLGNNKSIFDELFIITISCNNDELDIIIKSKAKNPKTDEKEDFEIDINFKKERFSIPSTEMLYTQEPLSIYEVVNMSNVGENQSLKKNGFGNVRVAYNKYHLDKGIYCIIFDGGEAPINNYVRDGYQFYDSNYNRVDVKEVIDVNGNSEYQCLFEITKSGDYYLYVRALYSAEMYRLDSYTNSHEVHDITNIDNLSGKIEGLFDYHLMEFTSDKRGVLQITNNSSQEVYIIYYRDDISPSWEKKKIKANEFFDFPIYLGDNKMYIVSQFNDTIDKNFYDFYLQFERIYIDNKKISISYKYGEEITVIYGEIIECEFEITEAGKYMTRLSNSNMCAHIYNDDRIKIVGYSLRDIWYLEPGTYIVSVFLNSQSNGILTTTRVKIEKLDGNN